MYNILKRFFDIVFSLVCIVLLTPMWPFLIIWIKYDSKGPVLFKQDRIGKNKKHFMILKFRTMKTETPSNIPTHLMGDPTKWITKSGNILRKTSLDELPQLFNVLKGEMSFVGPRPALWNQDDLIGEREIYKVNNFKPGITGLAQVRGRDGLLISEKVLLDKEYCNNLSLLSDLSIIVKTILKVLCRDGVIEGRRE